MTVPFFGLVQNFFLVIPVGPVKAPFKISPDQYRSNTWLVDGITLRVICSAILAASKALPNGFSPPFWLLMNLVFVIPHSAQIHFITSLLFLALTYCSLPQAHIESVSSVSHNNF